MHAEEKKKKNTNMNSYRDLMLSVNEAIVMKLIVVFSDQKEQLKL